MTKNRIELKKDEKSKGIEWKTDRDNCEFCWLWLRPAKMVIKGKLLVERRKGGGA